MYEYNLPSSVEEFTKVFQNLTGRLRDEHHGPVRKCGKEGGSKEGVDCDTLALTANNPNLVGRVGAVDQIRINEILEVLGVTEVVQRILE